MNLDAALETYVVESRELLEQMEQTLLRPNQEHLDAEVINSLFRVAHTIKGSAGLFGLDRIVEFTHTVESVLDAVREGVIVIDPALSRLLLECCDHMGALIGLVAHGSEPDTVLLARGTAVQERLRTYLTIPEHANESSADPSTPPLASQSTAAASDYWHLSLRFGTDVLRNGMDPLSFLRYLATIGSIAAVHTRIDAMPGSDDMDPESCYLAFEVGLRTQADRATIEGVFDFVRDDCAIQLLPPGSPPADYLDLIDSLPGQRDALCNMLLHCGALTQATLDAGPSTLTPIPTGNDIDQPSRHRIDSLDETTAAPKPLALASLDKPRDAKEQKAQEARFIRLDAEKLDDLINRIGELVIAGAGIGLAAKRVGASELLEAASTLANLVEDVRDSALKLRMVQIGATFNRFQRVVHDVAHELGKDIALAISGADTELDKTMVERIGDPLMHLVRNAMDHGIEPPEVRIACGKPAQGTVELRACHDAGSILIEVRDDGRGLARDRILEKAIERGLVAPGESLSDRDVYRLIFEPGFSTATQVSNLSGRGVGMDVVKTSITEMRGTVAVDSTPGVGTTVSLRLPLTLAIIDGFLVGVGDSVFVVPLDMVEECVELTPEAQREAHGRSIINLRGKVLPFIAVRDLFGIRGQSGGRQNILVVRYAGQRAGLVVDELMGEAQTVIKPLGKLFKDAKGIGGSTILGDGRVALILDVPGLVETAHIESKRRDDMQTAA